MNPRLKDEDVRSELARILASPQFASSERLRSFLSFVVEHALSGSTEALKEYSIGLHVYRRGTNFDPKIDSIVRTEANRLRSKLSDYYRDHLPEAIRIDLPRGGYMPAFTPTASQSLSVQAPRSETVVHEQHAREVEGTRGRRWTVFAIAGVLACVLVAALFLRGGVNRAQRDRRDIILTPLINLTNNPALNKRIEPALEVALASEPGLNVVAHTRVETALALTARPKDAALTRDVARDVAMRDGHVHALVSGVVTASGSGHRLGITVVDPRTDQTVAAMQVNIRQEDVTGGVDAIAARIERAVAAMPDIPTSELPLEVAVTSSMSALRSYTRAMVFARDGKWAAAEPLFRNALAEDTEFASAHLFLAWTLVNLDRAEEEWSVELDKATALSSRATEHEQMFIRASDLSLHRKDAEAIEAYEALLAVYPNDFWAANNLAFHSSRLDPARTSLYYARAADQRPRDFAANLDAAWNLALDGRPGESARYAGRAKAAAAAGDATFALDVLAANAAWLAGQPAKARAIVSGLDRQAATTDRDAYAAAVGLPALGLGFLDLAEGAIGRWGDPVLVHRWLAWAAVARADAAAFDRHAARLAGSRVNPASAIILIRAGRLDPAKRMLANRPVASIPFARSTHLYGLWQVVEGELALAEGHNAAAVSHLQAGFESLDDSLFPEYFVAAERLAGLLRRRGDISRARAILDRAVSRRQQVFLERLFFWRRCAEALVALDEETGQASRSADVAAALAALLGHERSGTRADSGRPGVIAPPGTN